MFYHIIGIYGFFVHSNTNQLIKFTGYFFNERKLSGYFPTVPLKQ